MKFIYSLVTIYFAFASAKDDCPNICGSFFAPVCAEFDDGHKQTFGSGCELDVYNCMHKTSRILQKS